MGRVIKSGFSKLRKEEKRNIVAGETAKPRDFILDIEKMDHPDPEIQELIDQFSENTIANFYLPFAIAPNFLLNGNNYYVPMVTEESSVVAACSAAAKFWSMNGGFRAKVINTAKTGQLHFIWNGDKNNLQSAFPELKTFLLQKTEGITEGMRKRGGGIRDIHFEDLTDKISGCYQLKVEFETVDSMGANFINTCLEEMGVLLKRFFSGNRLFNDQPSDVEIIMAILSNYNPECLVECYVETDVKAFEDVGFGMTGAEFAEKFRKAVEIAHFDRYRAVTHNKGIFNGIDAVIIATGNDFRAVEAGGHAYASRDGNYRGLSYVIIEENKFHFGLKIPLAVGTVGGLTGIHPLARWSFEILAKPDARQLMMIAAAAGLANNYSAIKSLITTGIQSGHMKMHLGNILSFLQATDEQKRLATEYFEDKKVSYDLVRKYLHSKGK